MNRSFLLFALICSSATTAACFESNSRRSDSQSHWLRQCDETADCETGLECLCGVCTERCDGDNDCGGQGGPDATCTEVADIGGCQDVSGDEQVCLASCEEDDGCQEGGSDLACVGGSCVGPARTNDGGLRPPGSPVLTVEGYLECDALLERIDELTGELVAEHGGPCETHDDCTCAVDEVLCRPSCAHGGILAERSEQFAEAIDAISEDYCSDDQYRFCSIPVPGCQECAAICMEGRCAWRPNTSLCVQWDCIDDRLCHLDGSCVDPGTEDRLGVATLAMAAAPPDETDPARGIGQFAVDGDAIFWFDLGTFDTGGAHNRDGAIHQRLLSSGETTVLASGLGLNHPQALHIDDDRVYYTDDAGAYALPRDASAEPIRLFTRAGEDWPPFFSFRVAPWYVDDGWVYYSGPFRSAAVRRVRPDGTGDELFYEGESGSVHRLGGTATHVLVEWITVSGPATRLDRVDKETLASETLVAAFRETPTDDDGPLIVTGEFIVTDTLQTVTGNGLSHGIQRHSLISGDRVELVAADPSNTRLRSADAGHVYFSSWLENSGWLGQASLEPAEPQRLRTTNTPIGHIVAADGYLYWVEAHRLLRMALP